MQGDGPYPVGGLVIDKPVTIQGMLGYLPVLEYSPPTTKSGLQADVTKDPDASAMFLVRGGPVVLEGLSIRFDAPVVENANWRVAETNANAYLQLLNCTVSSTTSKKPVKVWSSTTRCEPLHELSVHGLEIRWLLSRATSRPKC